jgi:hypothetical protein
MVNVEQTGRDPFEERVRVALRREAETVQPSDDGLTRIQARTAGGARGRAQRRWFAAGTAMVATAAAVTAVVLVGTGVLGLGLGGGAPTPAAPATQTQALQVFYLDSTPETIGEPGSEFVEDPRLYRETHRVPVDEGMSDVEAAVRELAGSTPDDPDYVNPWSDADLRSVDVQANRVVVEVGEPLRDEVAQQLAHTVQAAAGQQTEVVVRSDAFEPRDTVVQPASPLEAFARIWVTTPAQRATVDSPVTFTGMAATFEGNVAYEIKRGQEVVAGGATIAAGGMGSWSEWSFTERLQPGDYTLVTFDEDPALGGRRDVDTKDFTVR